MEVYCNAYSFASSQVKLVHKYTKSLHVDDLELGNVCCPIRSITGQASWYNQSLHVNDFELGKMPCFPLKLQQYNYMILFECAFLLE